ncbi:MAG: hypothetical protein ACRDRK_00400 [Pseudonocardia sp.]
MMVPDPTAGSQAITRRRPGAAGESPLTGVEANVYEANVNW